MHSRPQLDRYAVTSINFAILKSKLNIKYVYSPIFFRGPQQAAHGRVLGASATPRELTFSFLDIICITIYESFHARRIYEVSTSSKILPAIGSQLFGVDSSSRSCGATLVSHTVYWPWPAATPFQQTSQQLLASSFLYFFLFPVDSSSSLLAIYALFLLPSFFALFVLGSLLLRLFCWLFPHSVCATLVRSYTHCCFFLLLLCFSTAQIWLHLFYLISYRSFNLDSRGLAVETPCKSKPGMLIFLSLHQVLKLMHVPQ